MKTLTVLYFASLRDVAGIEQEQLQTSAVTLRDLYLQLQQTHGFGMPLDQLRVAINGKFARWDDPVADASEVVFIPPVSGG